MKKETIKKHLKAYSVYGKRNSTINHAFASAIAPFDIYSEKIINEALYFLGQTEDTLKCVFCNANATGWDHLTGLVKDKGLRGYGHQIGNLVPCCGTCNSKKGKKEFAIFINESDNIQDKEILITLLENYQNQFAKKIDIENLKIKNKILYDEYQDTKEQIFALMKKADTLADELRKNIVHN
jgi:hypothetical protein